MRRAVKDRSSTARLSSLVGGLLMALFGAFVTKAGFDLLYPARTGAGEALVNEGMIILAAGLLILVGGGLLHQLTEQRRAWAAFVLALAILGWVQGAAFALGSGLPGLFFAASIGPILSLVGGILAFQRPPSE